MSAMSSDVYQPPGFINAQMQSQGVSKLIWSPKTFRPSLNESDGPGQQDDDDDADADDLCAISET